MVNTLNFINKVINKAKFVANPTRTNPMTQIRTNQRIASGATKLTPSNTNLDSHVNAGNKFKTDDVLARAEGSARIDRSTGKLIDPDSITGPDSNALLGKGRRLNTEHSDRFNSLTQRNLQKKSELSEFLRRPDTPEVKDIKRGPPSGKQLDYWALGKARPGSNRTPANDYHDFLMGRPPQKTVSGAILKGTMKEKIKSMKKYPGLYKKLKKKYPGLSDEQLIKKMNELELKSTFKEPIKKNPYDTPYTNFKTLSQRQVVQGYLDNPNMTTFKKGSNNAFEGFPIKRKRVKLSGKQQKKLRSQRNIKENEFSAKNIIADIFDGSFFMGKDKAEFKRLSG